MSRPVPMAAASGCSDPYKRSLAIEILDGPQLGGKPPAVRKAVIFEIIVKNGQVKGYRTVLIATLAGAHPSLGYDRRRCAR